MNEATSISWKNVDKVVCLPSFRPVYSLRAPTFTFTPIQISSNLYTARNSGNLEVAFLKRSNSDVQASPIHNKCLIKKASLTVIARSFRAEHVPYEQPSKPVDS